MATKPAVPRKLTTSQTKQEMLAAYNDLVKQLEERREAEAKPQEKIEQRATAEAVKVAEELATEGVVKQVGDLRSTIGRLLSQVAGQLEEQVDRYGQIAKAIAFKERELAEIYEIQKSALSLAALLAAQEQKRDEFQAEMAQAREALEAEIAEARARWGAERKQYEAEVKERDAAEAKRRKREEEEYRYAFAREQQQAKDRAADEQARAQREFEVGRDAAEKELAERERLVASSERELAELRARVEASGGAVEAAVQRAVKETTARLQSESQAREELLKRDFAGERNVFTTRIDALERTVKQQAEQIARLSEQSERAYAQVQDIAVKALEGPAAYKSFAPYAAAPVEPPRRPSPEK
jgi:uncharacterized lipoprotein YmbA